MRGKRKKSRVAGALAALLGFVCALVLGVLFYGTMVYQLAGEDRTAPVQTASVDTPGGGAQAGGVAFPGKLLSLGEGELTDEQATQELVEGVRCTVVTRVYTLGDGTRALAVSATPAAYMAKLAELGYAPQLVTGFALAELGAVCEARDGELLLAARDGDFVYFIAAGASEQTMFALGSSATLE